MSGRSRARLWVQQATVIATLGFSMTFLQACRSEGCVNDGYISAWTDVNGDGLREDGEPPLDGAKFAIIDERELGEYGSALPWHGSGEYFFHFMYPCGKRQWVISATPPHGYRPTTPNRLPEGPTLLFGFAPTSPRATPTAR
jgi:hypothetical protein